MLDYALAKEAILLSGVKTKKDVIALALDEFVMSRKRLNLLERDGKITSQRSLKYASDLRSMSYKKNCLTRAMEPRL